MNYQPDPYRAGAALLARTAAPAAKLNVDIALAIGGSPAMEDLCRRLSGDADFMADSFAEALPDWARQLPLSLRMRVIYFRDAFMDCQPFSALSFCEMPRRSCEIDDFLSECIAGGGSPAKSAMEAIHLAMLGNWNRADGIRRHIILLMTDCPAYLPEDPVRRIDQVNPFLLNRHSALNDPMPETMDLFRRQWRDGIGAIDNWNSRLCIIAPECVPWDRMADWPRTRMILRSAEEIHHMTADHAMQLCGSLI